MLWFKSCPKCRGDLAEERDQYGMSVTCVQCGYSLRDAEATLLRRAHGAAPWVRRAPAAAWAAPLARRSRPRTGDMMVVRGLPGRSPTPGV